VANRRTTSIALADASRGGVSVKNTLRAGQIRRWGGSSEQGWIVDGYLAGVVSEGYLGRARGRSASVTRYVWRSLANYPTGSSSG